MTRSLDQVGTQSHEEQSVEARLEEYRPYLLNLLYQLSSDRELAADLTQEVLLRAWKSFGTFRGDAPLKTWLARIALNVYRTEWRRQQRRPHVSQVLETIQVPDSSRDPARIVCRREFQWCILHVLQHHLTDAQRVVLVLRDLQGLSYNEIAGILGVSLSAVKSRLHRARVAFRDHLRSGGCEALVRDYMCTCDGVKEI